MGSSLQLWTCCYCGHGPMNTATTASCVICVHRKCRNCHLETHRTSRGSGGGGGGLSNVPKRARQPTRPERSSSPPKPIPKSKGTESRSTEDQSSRQPVQKEAISASQRGQRRSGAAADGSQKQIASQVVDTNTNEPGKTIDESTRGTATPNCTDDLDASTLSDTETVFSRTSGTTLADADAVALISQRLSVFHGLGQLWPQLISRFGDLKAARSTIQELLVYYSWDLTSLATQNAATESKICVSTADIIRKSHQRIASSILEAHRCHSDDMRHNEDAYHEKHVDEDDIFNERDSDAEYGDYAYPINDESIFEQAVQILRSRVKALIRLEYFNEKSQVSKLLGTVEVFAMNMFSRIYEAPCQPGRKRLRWKCVS